ncbi:uncharacterized protein LOC110428563 isoform X2 [Herrania umbratica]|uniref:Uncharacterized protein LOC110428563 isoform X2 n=1 Tax=Herrania umbratica TaxID=108875 RepID=A0A6J1BKJ7_9ROSI|nr:uncharacterized protein LOC110428563 isoform X2 [Herrania umbratica]
MPASISLMPCLPANPLLSISFTKLGSKTTKFIPLETNAWKIRAVIESSSSSSVFGSFHQTVGGQVLPERGCFEKDRVKSQNKKRVFDGEKCNEQRRQLLPSYKAHRRKFFRQPTTSRKFVRSQVGRSEQLIMNVLRKCNVPVVKIEGNEADDVVATLVEQVLQRGYHVVIASPDKDFKQLISENVQIVMPLVELDRWSFYTLKHYIAQYNCDPHSDLSLRCIMGDEVDGVPGIQHLVPGFGRKTALKLLKKHGSLENLLNAAAVRTVGRQYAQEALTKYADYLRRNYEVLALRRDVDVHLQEEWLVERDTRNDSSVLSKFFRSLEDTDKPTSETRSNFSNGYVLRADDD